MTHAVQIDKHYRAWLIAASAMIMVVVAESYFFRDTWYSLFLTWTNVTTYNYGLIVPLISAALLYRSREHWLCIEPSPSFWGVIATAAVAIIWTVGYLAGIQLLQHFGVLAFIPASALAVFGQQFMRIAAFPFAYLLLATPFGEFMVPALISLTADFSVAMLEFIGIPVFRDGPYIRIPAGDFHVIKACSGIQYLLTSVVLGVLFAYLGFRTWKRRAAFIAICIVVPIVANWIRATGIILLGHVSDMKIAAGVDHFIYGWLFFGIVMLIIFLIGRRFSDGSLAEGPLPANISEKSASASRGPFLIAVATLAVASSAQLVTGLAIQTSGLADDRSNRIALPDATPEWHRQDGPISDWRPVFVGARSVDTAGYMKGSAGVSIIVVYYDTQLQGAELVSAQNSLYSLSTWWLRFDDRRTVRGSTVPWELSVREVSVNDGERSRLLWSWYSISGKVYASEMAAKLATISAVISGKPADSLLVALSVDYDEDVESARATMAEFIDAHAVSLALCNQSGDACD